ncbi:MAG TPA: indolepyruvate oxidoreductase subunit beta [Verrucomicrobiae bacterium]|nr:indolepyruvate oxidoreductase subunit beta [Verrucomicrobiae bacterium]
MDKTISLLLVGVGGQGTILAAKILSEVAVQQGLEVKMSEVHGMSQRGGSVVTFVKFGTKVYSPLVEPGEADYIVAFEKLEALRWVHYLKRGGTLVLNDQEILPMPVITGAAVYPAKIIEDLNNLPISAVTVDALSLAKECGNIKAANVVLMGVLAKRTDIPLETWQTAIAHKVPAKFQELNQLAFTYGYNAG